jgi:hypothetical protein
MVRTLRPTPATCALLALAASTLSGCIAHPPAEFGTIGGIAPLPALATHGRVDQSPAPTTTPQRRNALDRSQWSPIALLAPSDLTLHPPHYAPPRLPETGDWRYDGTLPTELDVHHFGSSNAHQFKSLAYEPFLQVYDLVMIPVRMITGTPPTRLDASPDASYVRTPEAWSTELPRTGQPVGVIGGVVTSRPAEGRQL